MDYQYKLKLDYPHEFEENLAVFKLKPVDESQYTLKANAAAVNRK